MLLRPVELLQRGQRPGEQQPSLHLHDAAARRPLIEQAFGRRRFAAAQQNPRLEQRPLVASRHFFVGAERLPHLIGAIDAARPPKQVHQPGHGLGRAARLAQHRFIFRHGVRPAEQHANATAPVGRLGQQRDAFLPARETDRLGQQRFGGGVVAIEPVQPAQRQRPFRLTAWQRGGRRKDLQHPPGVEAHACRMGGERLAHPIQCQPRRGLRRCTRRRFHDARRIAQATGTLVH